MTNVERHDPASEARGYEELDPDQLFSHAPHARIVDVRERSEFEGALCRIPGAQLVPLQDLPRQLERWSREQPIVLVCRSGRRSAAAAAVLAAAGFTSVFNLRGGMLAYRAAELPADCGPCLR
jgi:rhodanese-related sulfurtransferase